LKGKIEEYQGGVVLLGHLGDDNVIMDIRTSRSCGKRRPCGQRHFGYTDGIGDPVFEGVPYDADRVNGRGKQVEGGNGALGRRIPARHIDQAKEYPPAPNPILLSRNGTYRCTAAA